jgi:inorganic pyrophosphatase
MRACGAPHLLALAALALAACTTPPPAATNLIDDPPAVAGVGLVHVVVEIPAGTNDKWEVGKADGVLRWEQRDGRPRVVQYLAYPGNYGMIPRTSLPRSLGGDGDPLDVLLLGPRVERGALVAARPVGVLRLADDGERDDKILAVPTSGPFSDVATLDALDARYPGALAIVETWFTHYKGPGRVASAGFEDEREAWATVVDASREYERVADGD